MENKQGKMRSGLTLIEIMLALTVIVVGVLGAMMFRYYSALDARKADIQVGAGRVALLILEGWKGAAGNIAYNPAGVGGIGSEVLNSPDISISGISSPYTVQLTGGVDTSYSASLSYANVSTGLRKLTVTATSGLYSVTISDYVRTN